MIWKETFRAALVEVDPVRLLALIRDAETAMTARSESLPTVSSEELLAMGDATCTLRILKRYALTGGV